MKTSRDPQGRVPRLAPFWQGYEVAGLRGRLIGVPFPSTQFFVQQNLAGVRWVACLASKHPEHRYDVHPWPLEFLERSELSSPLSAELDACRDVARVAGLVRDRVNAEEGVIVHCQMGAERTGAVIGTVLALEGAAPERAADAIADIFELQQPGWAGPDFPNQLAKAIRVCAAMVDARQTAKKISPK